MFYILYKNWHKMTQTAVICAVCSTLSVFKVFVGGYDLMYAYALFTSMLTCGILGEDGSAEEERQR